MNIKEDLQHLEVYTNAKRAMHRFTTTLQLGTAFVMWTLLIVFTMSCIFLYRLW